MARGDHIKVTRCRGLYTHHGIDMGDGTVIHFAGSPLRGRGARVIRSTLPEFLAGGTCRVVHHRGPVQPPEAVLAAAESYLNREGYCVFRNNCEHFASYCKTGALRSGQVRRLAVAGGATATATVLMATALARVLLSGRGQRRRA